MSDKCPKCGADLSQRLKYTFVCGTTELTVGGYEEGRECLRRQLAAANDKLAEMARLAEDSAKAADELAGVGGWGPIETNPEGAMSLYMDRNETDVSKVCWVDWIAGGRGMMFPKRKPTHWMPLPQPPKEADDA